MMGKLSSLAALDTNRAVTALKYLYFRLRGKRIIAHTHAMVRGVSNIVTDGTLYIGTDYVGFVHPRHRTFLNIRGSLVVRAPFTIGRGCTIDIGPNARCELGSGYITADTRFVIMHGLKIGTGVAISWGCLIIDEDFHHLHWDGKTERPHPIEIGDHVWIGSNVTILKGVRLANNVVVASNAVVTRSCEEENVLLAGNPAVIIKRNVTWQ